MAKHKPQVVNVDEVEEVEHMSGRHWGQAYKVLTPHMSPNEGRLSANLTRVPPRRSAVPFHSHQLEDEIFFILSGRGVFRYGDEIRDIRSGDCLACPAGTSVAHQIANPFDEDLVYLAVGRNDPNEVCVYPDTGKVLVRSLRRIGYLKHVHYEHGEPKMPRIFELADNRTGKKHASKRQSKVRASGKSKRGGRT
jgi:uncharacterized cupin superfamily protein